MFPQIFGKYVLEAEIAAGGMARVYLATLRGAGGFEKRLVVKQIRPELASDDAFVRRFIEEAKTAVELAHPNIVPVYELGVEQGVYYIAMELCEGATLSEMLLRTGPLSAEEGAYVGIEICRALDYAHRRASIVHRDVTPRNVMIDEEGAVRLIDFGIAAPFAGVKNEVFGSPGHMPPEQIAGRPLTPATDVFAVGALLVEAWTNQAPFRGATPTDSAKALEAGAPRLNAGPELEPLGDLVASALEFAAGKRPQTAEALARPLREFVKSADLGDIARRIGERARRCRQVPESAVLSELPESSARQGDTRTFAMQSAMAEWTRKLPQDPPAEQGAVAGPEPSTRVLKSEPASHLRTWVVLATMAVAMIALWWGLRGPSGVRALPPGPASAVSPSAPATIPQTEPSGSAAPTPAAPQASRQESAPTRVVTPQEMTSLVLTAEPPSTVSVNGRSYGITPVSQQLPAGTYAVVFDNPTLGLRRAASVMLSGGKPKKVHVDFTQGEGKVIVF